MIASTDSSLFTSEHLVALDRGKSLFRDVAFGIAGIFLRYIYALLCSIKPILVAGAIGISWIGINTILFRLAALIGAVTLALLLLSMALVLLTVFSGTVNIGQHAFDWKTVPAVLGIMVAIGRLLTWR